MFQTEKYDKVILPSVPDYYWKGNEDNPQRVTAIDPYTIRCDFDSDLCPFQPNKVNMIITTVRSADGTPGVLIDKTKLFYPTFYQINWITPNVNVRNNNIVFFSSVTSLTYSVTVPEGFYTTSSDLIAAIVTAMNTVTGSSGLTFSSTTITGFPNMYNLNSAGGSYYILNTCTASVYGKHLWNLPQDQVATNTKIVGEIGLLYTRYIDFCSKTLTQYTTNNSNGNSINNFIVLRIGINNQTIPNRQGGLLSSRINTRYRYDTTVTQCDFQLRDEFGNFLYVPAENGTSTFYWELTLGLE